MNSFSGGNEKIYKKVQFLLGEHWSIGPHEVVQKLQLSLAGIAQTVRVHTVLHTRSQVPVPTMLVIVCKYVYQKGSTAMLGLKRSAGVAP